MLVLTVLEELASDELKMEELSLNESDPRDRILTHSYESKAGITGVSFSFDFGLPTASELLFLNFTPDCGSMIILGGRGLCLNLQKNR